MIMFGTQITANQDNLSKIQEEYFYNSLRNPKPLIDAKIRQLRIVYLLNPKQYALLKKSLPYIVCGIFTPPYRRIENFAYTDRFIVDIDRLGEKQLSLEEVKSRVVSDSRVIMCFTSPSRDGLKVMFGLKERCYDAGIYSSFYKAFLKDFSFEFSLDQVIDNKTSDVTRACFVSVDNDAYYNAEATLIDMKDYVNTDNTTEFFDQKHNLDKESEANDKEEKKEERLNHVPDPDKDIIDQIKARLNPKAAKKEAKPIFVPHQLEEIIDDMKSYIEKTGIIVTEILDIQYAKKIRVKLGMKQAEINVFYGKRGFSVVVSPRCGTDEELNTLTADLINNFLYEYEA
jgi:hypothetical protein